VNVDIIVTELENSYLIVVRVNGHELGTACELLKSSEVWIENLLADLALALGATVVMITYKKNGKEVTEVTFGGKNEQQKSV